MSKQRTIIMLGILTALMPYSGFPSSWRTGFFLLAGISIAILGYQMDKKIKFFTTDKEKELTPFKDNRDAY